VPPLPPPEIPKPSTPVPQMRLSLSFSLMRRYLLPLHPVRPARSLPGFKFFTKFLDTNSETAHHLPRSHSSERLHVNEEQATDPFRSASGDEALVARVVAGDT